MAESVLDRDKLSVAVRSARGSMSLKEAASESGVSKDTLSRIERKALEPSLPTFARLCDWMDMSMDYFREDGEASEPVPA